MILHDKEHIRKICTSLGCSEINQMRCVPRNGCIDICKECYQKLKAAKEK